METRIRPEDQQDDTGKRDNPDDINSHRSGLGERDSVGPQADILSPTGARMDDEITTVEADLIRKGSTP